MKKENLKIIAGPCLAESPEILDETALHLKSVLSGYNCDFYFKASYRKANRSSVDSYEGPGDEKALNWIKYTGEKYGLKTLTDVHSVREVEMAKHYVDGLQIPAFLSRQTDLIKAAADTGLLVNIKKGQFMAPDDMKKAAEKAGKSGNGNIWLTERGTFFGYHDLVVDMRSILEMQKYDLPVIYDATHSLQKPSIGTESGGLREYTKPLAYAAVSLGVDGLFFETHPNPENAKSDSATQMNLSEVKEFIKYVFDFRNLSEQANA